MNRTTLISLVLLVGMLFSTMATANVWSTTMTWFVGSAKTISVAYGSPCDSSNFFFVESNAQFDPDTDGNASRVVPSSSTAADNNCQSASKAGMVITASGTAASLNVDANFSSALAGVDVNLVLKVWMSDGTGCGTDGLGGWEEPCSVTGTTTPVTSSTCKNFNSSNWTAGTRLVSSLPRYDTNGLCFSGDFNGFVSSGSHTADFQLGSEFS